MRPIVRGDWPVDDGGVEIQFVNYSQARGELIRRLGAYCSYCEMHLDTSLAVEHIRPKKPPGVCAVLTDRELDWDNFLLACTNCNSTKGDNDVNLDEYVWPDRDNTYMLLCYSEGGLVTPQAGDQQTRAAKLIKLVGLDKMPDTHAAADRRWLNRREAWELALRAKARLSSGINTNDMRDSTMDTAKAKGYWSIWFTVFNDDPDMLQRLIDGFAGTSKCCFDNGNNFIPVERERLL